MKEYMQLKRMTRAEIMSLQGQYSCNENDCEKAFLWFVALYMTAMTIMLMVILRDIKPELFDFFQ